MPSPSVALLRTQSDDRLVALAASGHERAFEAIVERYRRQLLRHARRHLPEARAEDALQQALVSAWTGLRRGDDVRALRPWLHRIVHNATLNVLRAPGYDYEELRATLQGSGGPAELAEHRAIVHTTLAGLAALPERQRAALLQIAVEGRSQDEVAEQLGLSHGAVRQLVHRARTALRAAATAVMPLPLAAWLATAGAGRGDVAVRVTELVAGAGGSATLAKAGAVAAIAGGAVAGPAVVHDVAERGQRSSTEAAANADAGDREARADGYFAPVGVAAEPVAAALPVNPRGTVEQRPGGERSDPRDDDARSRGDRDGDNERGEGDRGSRGGDDAGTGGRDDRERSAPGDDGDAGDSGGDRQRGDDEHGSDDDDEGTSGPGMGGESNLDVADDDDSGDDDDRERGDDEPGSDDDDEGTSGPGMSGESDRGADGDETHAGDDEQGTAGSGDDGGAAAEPTPQPSVTPEPTPTPTPTASPTPTPGAAGDESEG